ncbi:MAG: hypothetical protein HY544_05215 [Candidatus Diapherotrites archaeon]|uniref:Uncharacterized protein n=1 Tax=Candidatus Iainarchaeum sp. TaxID=3101447 RepID=A0A8T3YNP8_9ARCH|nr:hypothetical protein [Candidatus Diapherotrites archaeon]
MKKGQVTVFLIAAVIILLIGVAFLLYLNKPFRFAGSASAQDAINRFVLQCIENTAAKGVRELGLQGGYYRLPSGHFEKGDYGIPYYFDRGADFSPSIGTLESEFSDYMDDRLPGCADFSEFGKQGVLVSAGNPSTSTGIQANRIVLSIAYPLTARVGDETVSLESFSYELDSNYGLSHQVSKKLAEKLVNDPEYRDYTFINSQPQIVSILPQQSYTDIYIVVDRQYNFLFAARFR